MRHVGLIVVFFQVFGYVLTIVNQMAIDFSHWCNDILIKEKDLTPIIMEEVVLPLQRSLAWSSVRDSVCNKLWLYDFFFTDTGRRKKIKCDVCRFSYEFLLGDKRHMILKWSGCGTVVPDTLVALYHVTESTVGSAVIGFVDFLLSIYFHRKRDRSDRWKPRVGIILVFTYIVVDGWHGVTIYDSWWHYLVLSFAYHKKFYFDIQNYL